VSCCTETAIGPFGALWAEAAIGPDSSRADTAFAVKRATATACYAAPQPSATCAFPLITPMFKHHPHDTRAHFR
jgi:hypothetical protein